MITKIKSIKETVKSMLVRFPETRDNDRMLIVYVWATQNPNLKYDESSFRNFGTEFISGHYADPESIRRSRQKLQEENPELRGRFYNDRTGSLEEGVRKNINAI